MVLQLDQWQKDFIDFKKDKILVCGRQTGKSEAQAYDAAEYAATHPGTTTLIISKTERQSEELLLKVLAYLQQVHPRKVGMGKHKPLKSVAWVMHERNEKPSRVMCIPIGLAGEGARGLTIHKLCVDEAQLVPEAVFSAITPMLLTTGGKIALTGTPRGKSGYFYKAFMDKERWYVDHVNSIDVITNRPISQTWPEWKRTEALSFLEREKKRMSEKQFRQEYMGEFIEDLDNVFSEQWITKVCQAQNRDHISGRYYTIGVDVGRVVDPSTFQVLDGEDEDRIVQVESRVRKDYSIVQTAKEVLDMNKLYEFGGIGIDGGGMGAGVVDILLEDESEVASVVIDLNNAKKDVSWEEKPQTRRLLKEDMYRNLQALGDKGKIKLLNDDEVIDSLRSVQIEYKEGTTIPIIFGNNTHITEGIIRAAWLLKSKSIKLFATSSSWQ